MQVELEYRELKTQASWLIGATTHAMDRIVPEIELIRQTAADRPGGVIRLTAAGSVGNSKSIVSASRRCRLRDLIRPSPAIDIGEDHFVDLRLQPWFNWAIHLNKDLLFAMLCREKFATDPWVVIPGGMPAIMHELYAMFGFRVISTNGVVRGREIVIHDPDAIHIETARSQIIAALDFDFAACIRSHSTGRQFGKVFLNRRGTRVIENEAEIVAFLASQGYETIYPETLSAADQMRLWLDATDVVSIHGAGMAPLQFREPGRPPLRLLEIMPVGHMTRFFCAMCHDVGGHYVGVRGRLKPGYVEGLYRFDRPFYAHSLDSFGVDLRSLQVGLHLLAGGQVEDRLPSLWNLQYRSEIRALPAAASTDRARRTARRQSVTA